MKVRQSIISIVLIQSLVIVCNAAPQNLAPDWFPFRIELPKPPPQIERFINEIPMHARNFFDQIQNSLPKSIRRLFPQEDLEKSEPKNEDREYVRQMIVPPVIDNERSLNPLNVSPEDKAMIKDMIAPSTGNTGSSVHVQKVPPKDKNKEMVHGMLVPPVGDDRDIYTQNKNAEAKKKKEQGRSISFINQVINGTMEVEKSIEKTIASNMNSVIDGFRERVKPIYPGTQWCGSGNRARSAEELGLFSQADNCCRQHDSCPEYIELGAKKYGLQNSGLFTRSHCDCDQEFYDCLKENADVISGQIGTAYFTALGPKCFRLDHKIVGCKVKRGLTRRCIEYKYDNSSEKIYQWFDNPEF